MKFEDCNTFKRIPVIYGIKNVLTNKWYIGSCKDMYDRFVRHRSLLKCNKHHSQKLQHSYNKYGEDSFEIFILQYLDNIDTIEEIIEIENDTIIKYNSIDNGYNMIPATKYIKEFIQSEDAKIKAAKTHMKKVVCINRFTNIIHKIYNSITEAAKDLNLETSNIANVCKSNKSARFLKDFVFVYFDDYDKNKDYRVLEHHMKNVPKSEEWKRKARLSNKRAKKVFKYDLQGNLIIIYPSRSEAERQNNMKKEFLRCRMDKPLNNYIYTYIQK